MLLLLIKLHVYFGSGRRKALDDMVGESSFLFSTMIHPRSEIGTRPFQTFQAVHPWQGKGSLVSGEGKNLRGEILPLLNNLPRRHNKTSIQKKQIKKWINKPKDPGVIRLSTERLSQVVRDKRDLDFGSFQKQVLLLVLTFCGLLKWELRRRYSPAINHQHVFRVLQSINKP